MGLPLLILCCWSLCPKVVPQESSTSKGPRTVSNLTWIARSPKGLGLYDCPSQTVSRRQPFCVFPLFFSGSQLWTLQPPEVTGFMKIFPAHKNANVHSKVKPTDVPEVSHVLVATRAVLGSMEKKTIASSLTLPTSNSCPDCPQTFRLYPEPQKFFSIYSPLGITLFCEPTKCLHKYS